MIIRFWLDIKYAVVFHLGKIRIVDKANLGRFWQECTAEEIAKCFRVCGAFFLDDRFADFERANRLVENVGDIADGFNIKIAISL